MPEVLNRNLIPNVINPLCDTAFILNLSYSRCVLKPTVKARKSYGEVCFIVAEYAAVCVLLRHRRGRSRRFASTTSRRGAACAAGYAASVNFESGIGLISPRPSEARNSVVLTAGTTFADLSRCLNISSSAAATAAAAAAFDG